MGSARVPVRLVSGVLGLVAASVPSAWGQLATPAEPGISLVWTAPDECPKQLAVIAEVARHAPEAASGVPGFSARGSVTRSDGVYRLELETLYGERRGSRQMQDASCTELTRAAAVVIALAIRPDAVETGAATPAPAPVPTPLQPEPAPPPPPPPPPETSTPSAPPATPPAEDTPRSSGGLDAELWTGAGFAGELGTLPGFAPGFALSVEARTEWLRAGLSAQFLPAQRTTPSVPSDPFLALDYFGVDALGCVGALKQQLAPGACAGAGVGRLRARSRQATTPGEGSTLWVTPRLGVFALYRALPALTLEAGVHVRVATKETSFTVENFGPVHETGPLALLLGAGASVRIW